LAEHKELHLASKNWFNKI